MRGRVTGAGSVMFAESVSRALSGPLGRAEAQDVVAAAARTAAATGTPFRDVVRGGPPRDGSPGCRRAGERASTPGPTCARPPTWSP